VTAPLAGTPPPSSFSSVEPDRRVWWKIREARAYPFPLLRRQSPVMDRLGGEPILLVVGGDRKSIRVFKTRVEGRSLTFSRMVGRRPRRLVDAETGSEWSFAGVAVAGPLEGTRLEKVFALKEYWFDWKTYHPDTTVYSAGTVPGRAITGSPAAVSAPAADGGL